MAPGMRSAEGFPSCWTGAKLAAAWAHSFACSGLIYCRCIPLCKLRSCTRIAVAYVGQTNHHCCNCTLPLALLPLLQIMLQAAPMDMPDQHRWTADALQAAGVVLAASGRNSSSSSSRSQPFTDLNGPRGSAAPAAFGNMQPPGMNGAPSSGNRHPASSYPAQQQRGRGHRGRGRGPASFNQQNGVVEDSLLETIMREGEVVSGRGGLRERGRRGRGRHQFAATVAFSRHCVA